MLIDTLAQRYGKLPSQLLAEADTFDLMVFDVAMTYQAAQSSKQNKQAMPTKAYDQSQLQEIMNKVKK